MYIIICYVYIYIYISLPVARAEPRGPPRGCHVFIGIFRCPLFRGPLIIRLHVPIWPYLAKCLYK